MKRAVSISLGSSKRNSAVELDLFGERVCIERIGADGDMERAAQLFGELDGQVDAFGVGGTDLGLTVGEKFYKLHSVAPLIRYVRRTPVVDGSGLKNTLERRVAGILGKEDAVYMPSGTMTNQVAIRAHTEPGDEVLADARAHVAVLERGAPAALSGVTMRALPGRNGIFTAAEPEANAIAAKCPTFPAEDPAVWDPSAPPPAPAG